MTDDGGATGSNWDRLQELNREANKRSETDRQQRETK